MSEESMNHRAPGELTPAERELERALGGLRPASGGLSREVVLFEAGRAAARRRPVWPWMGACTALACATAVLGAMALRGPEVRERVVMVRVEVPAAARELAATPGAAEQRRTTPEDSVGEYLRLRQAVMTHGLEALPAPGAAPVGGLGQDLLRSVPAWQRGQVQGDRS